MGFLFHGVSNSRHNGYSSHSLEILGLIIEDLEKQKKQSSAFPEKVFKRTDLYLSFYLDIYKDQIPASWFISCSPPENPISKKTVFRPI